MKSIFNKKKKKRFMLIIEIFFSFIAFFIVLSLFTKKVTNTQYPLGFEYENLYKINFKYPNISWDSIEKTGNVIYEYISSFPGVQNTGKWYASFSFQEGKMNPNSDLIYNDVKFPANQIELIGASDNIAATLNLQTIQGRWFSKEDNSSKNRPAVISENLKHLIFGNKNALGEIVDYCGQQCKIVGVCNNFKHKGDYTQPRNIFIVRYEETAESAYGNDFCMSGYNCGIETFLKVNNKLSSSFELDLIHQISTKFPGFKLLLFPLEKQHNKYKKRTLMPLLIVLIFLLFLFLNVIFGLFGVLWYSISLRKSEIGLRMAVGASKNRIYKQFVGEMLLLATLGIVPGIIIAMQFPILKVFEMETFVYIIAMALSALLIYILVILCALFPSAQAAGVQPALALHEE